LLLYNIKKYNYRYALHTQRIIERYKDNRQKFSFFIKENTAIGRRKGKAKHENRAYTLIVKRVKIIIKVH